MGVARISLQVAYPGTGGPGYCTFHFRDDGDGDRAAALQVATDALETAFTTLRGGYQSNIVWGTDGRWVDVDTEEIIDTDGWSLAGTSVGSVDILPPATTLVVGWGSSSASRSARGRTFLSGFNESDSINGVPSSAALGRARALGSSIVNFNGTLGNGAFVIYSPTYRVSRDITRSAVRPIWAVLRSRRD